MNGLYALKPWYADRLAGTRAALVRRDVSPDTLTWAGVVCAAAAAAALGLLPAPYAALPVAVLLAARLAFANLDGALARDTGRCTRRGTVLNELGDRLADLAVLAGFLFVAPLWLVACAALAATLPSWVSLAGAAAGAPRHNGGPVGKTERCALAVLAAASGWYVPVLAAVAAGSVLTAALRLARIWRELGDEQGDGQGRRNRPGNQGEKGEKGEQGGMPGPGGVRGPGRQEARTASVPEPDPAAASVRTRPHVTTGTPR